MNEQREIVKASWLQHVVHKKGGTLHRKKKVLYEEGKWVVLCVHNDRIPLLEWYFSEEYVHGHRPSKVIDLLDSSFVRVIMSDPSRRSFMIGFMDCSRDAIELSALTIEDCDDWIRSTTTTLIRLKCLMESTNFYASAPDFASESSRTTEQFVYEDANLDVVPEELAPSVPVSSPRNSEYERIRFPSLPAQPSGISSLPRTLSAEEKKVKNHVMVKTPPPLPPRNISSLQAVVPKTGTKRCSIYDHPKNRASTSFGDSSTVEGRLGDISLSPQNSVATPVLHSFLQLTLEGTTLLDIEIAAPVSLCSESMKRGYSVPTGTLNVNVAHSRRITGNVSSGTTFSVDYDAPSGMINRMSPSTNIALQKACSTSERNSSGVAEDHNSQVIDNSDISSGLRNLTVQPFICMQHIAYVDFGGKVWVTGWTAVAEKYLAGQLFVGDQLLRIADIDIYSTQQIPFIFSAASKTGLSVNIAIQRVPHGTIYTLKKTKQKYDAGLILDKRKIKLADVLEGSPAWEAGIRASVPAITRTGTTSACITCVNNYALNIFSEDDEVLKQIDTLPLSVFTLMVQPYDFVKLLKRSLKKLKNVYEFVH
uniref:PH domain-containing protein n=1 Tax=Elaeophora elaphi TaxID=1147741 RepID=A0A0R3RWS7_9BILA